MAGGLEASAASSPCPGMRAHQWDETTCSHPHRLILRQQRTCCLGPWRCLDLGSPCRVEALPLLGCSQWEACFPPEEGRPQAPLSTQAPLLGPTLPGHHSRPRTSLTVSTGSTSWPRSCTDGYCSLGAVPSCPCAWAMTSMSWGESAGVVPTSTVWPHAGSAQASTRAPSQARRCCGPLAARLVGQGSESAPTASGPCRDPSWSPVSVGPGSPTGAADPTRPGDLALGPSRVGGQPLGRGPGLTSMPSHSLPSKFTLLFLQEAPSMGSEGQQVAYPGSQEPPSESKPFLAPMISNQRVTGPSHFQDVRLIEFDISGSGIR